MVRNAPSSSIVLFLMTYIRPGDNPNQCAQGYSCPPFTLTLDPFVPFNSRFVDVGAGGPSPFAFTATSNVSWLKVTPSGGSVSPLNPEVRVEATVDWTKVEGVQVAQIDFNATAQDQKPLSVPVIFVANHTKAPDGFKGVPACFATVYFFLLKVFATQGLSREMEVSLSKRLTHLGTRL